MYISIGGILIQDSIDFEACECGHERRHHLPDRAMNCCAVWACLCFEFKQMDWVTEFCDVPERIHTI